MKSAIFAVAAAAGVANAWNGGNYSLTASTAVYTTTEIVSSYTTYCPFATSVVQNNKTYIATASETLTITDCPCTLTHKTTGIPAPSATPYTSTTTEVVSTYTTFCPEATKITEGTKTYTATASETLTITECPCTLTKSATFTPGVLVTSTGLVASTVTLSTYTTVCPSSTTFTVKGPSETATYTATPSQTVTVTNSPTVTATLVPTTSVITPTTPAASQVATTQAANQAATTTAVAGVASGTVASSGFGVAVTPTASTKPFTGAASKLSGAGVAGLLGLAAFIL
ncbi:hypothetical protein P7C71_g3182, partial [Lecanoromycetidae sp. Uapishka_2]